MLVEKKKKSSNLKRKNKVKNLVEKRRPNFQVDLKEHCGELRTTSKLQHLLMQGFFPIVFVPFPYIAFLMLQ